LARERIDVVVASDLTRAWLTARTLADPHRIAVIAEPRLRERHFGRFQGHTAEEVGNLWPNDLDHWRKREVDWRIPDGESGREFITRVLAALSDLATTWHGSTVAVVTHGGALDIIYRHAGGIAWDVQYQYQILNAAVNRIRARMTEHKEESMTMLELSIDEWGDTAHLRPSRFFG